jgi:hypothetical protein
MAGRLLISAFAPIAFIMLLMVMGCSAFVGLQRLSSLPHHARVVTEPPHQKIRAIFLTLSPSLLFHSVDDNAFKTDDLPEWATANQRPPSDKSEVQILFLESDDFVSMELENEESTAITFCATVVYEDASTEPQFLVEPRIGTIESKGGTVEVTVKPIVDEDAAADNLSSLLPTCWLVISTETDAWYYKLEVSTTPSCSSTCNDESHDHSQHDEEHDP